MSHATHAATRSSARFGVPALISGLLLAGAAHAPATAAGGAVATVDGRTLAEFLLTAVDGSRHSLYAERLDRRATVLAFVEVGDPASRAAALAVAASAGERSRDGVLHLAISATATAANCGADPELAALQAAGVPLLLDPDLVVAADAGVRASGTVLLLDEAFRVVYRGVADDRFDGAALRTRPDNDYLANALDSLLAGEEIDPAATAVNGVDPWRLAPTRKVDFAADVAPLLHARCAECHRPGQPAPMELLDYEDAAGWAPMIAEVALAGRMPPWFADPRHGRFRNEARLTETEKKTLELFAAQGAPKGNLSRAPAPPTFADPEWRIGKPDVVIELPEAQPIPAEGVVQYRYAEVDPGFTEDQWIQASDCQPTARQQTHHVIAYLLPAGKSAREILRDPTGVLSLGALAGWAPGTDPLDLPDGFALRVPKGSRILFELHYNPNGTAASDRTRIAFRRTRVPVVNEVRNDAVMKFDFRIPPHKEDATFTATRRMTQRGLLLEMTPHMHVRGKAMRYELERDGVRRTLLDVPRYDFNWQISFELLEPVEIRPGDSLILTAVFDNSKGNPHNPNPGATVTWGDQSFEEMMIGYFDWYDPEAAPPAMATAGAGAQE
ncbi:MAG: hypothetical protein FJ293_13580 [Planctomycetes bacterium]|nr:hypothetical protein [Planctomycetota bacterium]